MADDNGWRKLAERVVPGLVPERTDSGARINVNSFGTTSVAPGSLSEIARRHFDQLYDPTDIKKNAAG
jgi:hypothetical protein